MNIYMHELRAYRNSTIIWSISLAAIVVLFMSMFPTFSRDIEDFTKLMEGFPEAVRQALGLEIESLGTILGFYSYAFLYLTLCGAIQAMNVGTSIVSKEVREKTADFLLTKPVTRASIMTAKIGAAVTSLLITNVVFITTASLMASMVKTEPYSVEKFLLISITLLLIQLIFLAIGIIISVVVPRIKSVLTVSLGTVFAFFIIGMLASTSGDRAKRYASPFQYYDRAYIIEHSRYEASFILVGLGIIVVAITASYVIYTRRDIHGV